MGALSLVAHYSIIVPAIKPVGFDRTGSEIDHFAISSRFRSCFLDVFNKRGANTGLAWYYLARPSESYLAELMAVILSKPPAKIDEHWNVIKNALFSGTKQFVGHVQKGHHKI